MAGAFAFSPLAFATGNNDHQCQRNCGSQDNGDSGVTINNDVDSHAQSNSWAQGGDGGSAVNANLNNAQNTNNVTSTGGTATNANNNNAQNNNNVTSTGGSANNANSNNANNSSNATGGQGGLGGSGGAGGQGGAATNNNTNSADNSSNATGGSSNATGGSASADNNGNNNGNNNSSSSNTQSQSQSQSANNESDNSNSNNSSQDVSVNSNYERNPVSTAYAAPLAVGEDTCMGSSSIGAQAVSFGLSIGTTWQDENCQRLKNSRQLVALGYQRAATSLMCVDDDVRHAMEEAGTPCPSGGAVVAVAEAEVVPAAYVQAPPVQEEVAPAPAPPRRHAPPRRRHQRAVSIEK